MPLPRLVVFARFPEPGRAKTRLIPALGAAGAAALHRRLVERTLVAVRASALPFELRTTGALPDAFRDWLGPLPAAADQGEGDLGARLRAAAAPYPTLLIGTDAPDLSAAHLTHAAAILATTPAALGPAADGGYWILGLSRPCDSVFDAMPWSTDRVAAETERRLRAALMPPVLLPVLADCDRPEDLFRWPDLLA
ncbi:MAG: TIGR04282 family arsenosugar biosynthesis glycosyltransferase [Gluconacetobacter diazotrophicus]|nr:TIGR04282 family arsenosugar biosynthesis glycosyltransferase [Gluconacetobacter diazotrophicus]